jgi:MFS family permease
MLASVRSLVDLRAAEARQVVRLGLALFALLAAYTLLETARDSLFLQALPVRDLAVAYGALATTALIASPAIARLVRRLGRRDALVVHLAIAALGTAFFYALPLGRPAILGLYVWTGVVTSVAVVQVWQLALPMFGASKRFLGALASAGAFGALAGAGAATALVDRFPVQHLLPIAAALLLLAAAATRMVDRDSASVDELPDTAGATRAFGTVRHESYLGRIAVLVAVSTAALLATDYLFKAGAARSIDAAALPAFFARYAGIVAILSLVVQVVGVGCMVRRNGVLAALTVLPFVLLLGAGGALAFGGAFAAVLVAKTADAVLRHSLHRASMELVWTPIHEDVRDEVKRPVDGALTRVTEVATAAALLALAVAGLDTAVVLAAVVAVLAAAWLVAATLMRRPYLDQFRQALARPTFAPADQDLDLDAVEVVVEAMSSPDPKQVRAAVTLLATHGKARLVSALVLLHDDADVLCDALDVVATPDRTDWIPQARRLLGHGSDEVRTAALRALARAGALDVSACEGHADAAMRGHVVFWRAHTRRDVEPIADLDVAAIANGPGVTAAAVLDAIGRDGDARWAPVVLAVIERAAPGDDIVTHAVPAIARVADARFIPFLIERLAVRRGRAEVLSALTQLGEPALHAAEAAFTDPATPAQLRVHLPQAIAAFGSQRAADFLASQLAVHGAAGYRVLRALARLAVRHGTRVDRRIVRGELERNLREYVHLLGIDAALARGVRDPDDLLTTLRGLLGDKRAQAVERAFLLLQAVHPGEDLRDVHQAVIAGSRIDRAHARELLVAVTRAQDGLVQDLLLLLADDLPTAEILVRGHALLDEPLPDRRDALASLLRDDDPAVVALAALYQRSVPVEPIDVASAMATIAIAPLPTLPLPPLAVLPDATPVPGLHLVAALAAARPGPRNLARGTGSHVPFDVDAVPPVAAHPGPSTSAAGPSLPLSSPQVPQGWAAPAPRSASSPTHSETGVLARPTVTGPEAGHG